MKKIEKNYKLQTTFLNDSIFFENKFVRKKLESKYRKISKKDFLFFNNKLTQILKKSSNFIERNFISFPYSTIKGGLGQGGIGKGKKNKTSAFYGGWIFHKLKKDRKTSLFYFSIKDLFLRFSREKFLGKYKNKFFKNIPNSKGISFFKEALIATWQKKLSPNCIAETFPKEKFTEYRKKQFIQNKKSSNISKNLKIWKTNQNVKSSVHIFLTYNVVAFFNCVNRKPFQQLNFTSCSCFSFQFLRNSRVVTSNNLQFRMNLPLLLYTTKFKDSKPIRDPIKMYKYSFPNKNDNNAFIMKKLKIFQSFDKDSQEQGLWLVELTGPERIYEEKKDASSLSKYQKIEQIFSIFRQDIPFSFLDLKRKLFSNMKFKTLLKFFLTDSKLFYTYWPLQSFLIIFFALRKSEDWILSRLHLSDKFPYFLKGNKGIFFKKNLKRYPLVPPIEKKDPFFLLSSTLKSTLFFFDNKIGSISPLTKDFFRTQKQMLLKIIPYYSSPFYNLIRNLIIERKPSFFLLLNYVLNYRITEALVPFLFFFDKKRRKSKQSRNVRFSSSFLSDKVKKTSFGNYSFSKKKLSSEPTWQQDYRHKRKFFLFRGSLFLLHNNYPFFFILYKKISIKFQKKVKKLPLLLTLTAPQASLCTKKTYVFPKNKQPYKKKKFLFSLKRNKKSLQFNKIFKKNNLQIHDFTFYKFNKFQNLKSLKIGYFFFVDLFLNLLKTKIYKAEKKNNVTEVLNLQFLLNSTWQHKIFLYTYVLSHIIQKISKFNLTHEIFLDNCQIVVPDHSKKNFDFSIVLTVCKGFLFLESQWEAIFENSLLGIRPGWSFYDVVEIIFENLQNQPRYFLQGEIEESNKPINSINKQFSFGKSYKFLKLPKEKTPMKLISSKFPGKTSPIKFTELYKNGLCKFDWAAHDFLFFIEQLSKNMNRPKFFKLLEPSLLFRPLKIFSKKMLFYKKKKILKRENLFPSYFLNRAVSILSYSHFWENVKNKRKTNEYFKNMKFVRTKAKHTTRKKDRQAFFLKIQQQVINSIKTESFEMLYATNENHKDFKNQKSFICLQEKANHFLFVIRFLKFQSKYLFSNKSSSNFHFTHYISFIEKKNRAKWLIKYEHNSTFMPKLFTQFFFISSFVAFLHFKQNLIQYFIKICYLSSNFIQFQSSLYRPKNFFKSLEFESSQSNLGEFRPNQATASFNYFLEKNSIFNKYKNSVNNFIPDTFNLLKNIFFYGVGLELQREATKIQNRLNFYYLKIKVEQISFFPQGLYFISDAFLAGLYSYKFFQKKISNSLFFCLEPYTTTKELEQYRATILFHSKAREGNISFIHYKPTLISLVNKDFSAFQQFLQFFFRIKLIKNKQFYSKIFILKKNNRKRTVLIDLYNSICSLSKCYLKNLRCYSKKSKMFPIGGAPLKALERRVDFTNCRPNWSTKHFLYAKKEKKKKNNVPFGNPKGNQLYKIFHFKEDKPFLLKHGQLLVSFLISRSQKGLQNKMLFIKPEQKKYEMKIISHKFSKNCILYNNLFSDLLWSFIQDRRRIKKIYASRNNFMNYSNANNFLIFCNFLMFSINPEGSYILFKFPNLQKGQSFIGLKEVDPFFLIKNENKGVPYFIKGRAFQSNNIGGILYCGIGKFILTYLNKVQPTLITNHFFVLQNTKKIYIIKRNFDKLEILKWFRKNFFKQRIKSIKIQNSLFLGIPFQKMIKIYYSLLKPNFYKIHFPKQVVFFKKSKFLNKENIIFNFLDKLSYSYSKIYNLFIFDNLSFFIYKKINKNFGNYRLYSNSNRCLNLDLILKMLGSQKFLAKNIFSFVNFRNLTIRFSKVKTQKLNYPFSKLKRNFKRQFGKYFMFMKCFLYLREKKHFMKMKKINFYLKKNIQLIRDFRNCYKIWGISFFPTNTNFLFLKKKKTSQVSFFLDSKYSLKIRKIPNKLSTKKFVNFKEKKNIHYTIFFHFKWATLNFLECTSFFIGSQIQFIYSSSCTIKFVMPPFNFFEPSKIEHVTRLEKIGFPIKFSKIKRCIDLTSKTTRFFFDQKRVPSVFLRIKFLEKKIFIFCSTRQFSYKQKKNNWNMLIITPIRENTYLKNFAKKIKHLFFSFITKILTKKISSFFLNGHKTNALRVRLGCKRNQNYKESLYKILEGKHFFHTSYYLIEKLQNQTIGYKRMCFINKNSFIFSIFRELDTFFPLKKEGNPEPRNVLLNSLFHNKGKIKNIYIKNHSKYIRFLFFYPSYNFFGKLLGSKNTQFFLLNDSAIPISKQQSILAKKKDPSIIFVLDKKFLIFLSQLEKLVVVKKKNVFFLKLATIKYAFLDNSSNKAKNCIAFYIGDILFYQKSLNFFQNSLFSPTKEASYFRGCLTAPEGIPLKNSSTSNKQQLLKNFLPKKQLLFLMCHPFHLFHHVLEPALNVALFLPFLFSIFWKKSILFSPTLSFPFSYNSKKNGTKTSIHFIHPYISNSKLFLPLKILLGKSPKFLPKFLNREIFNNKKKFLNIVTFRCFPIIGYFSSKQIAKNRKPIIFSGNEESRRKQCLLRPYVTLQKFRAATPFNKKTRQGKNENNKTHSTVLNRKCVSNSSQTQMTTLQPCNFPERFSSLYVPLKNFSNKVFHPYIRITKYFLWLTNISSLESSKIQNFSKLLEKIGIFQGRLKVALPIYLIRELDKRNAHPLKFSRERHCCLLLPFFLISYLKAEHLFYASFKIGFSNFYKIQNKRFSKKKKFFKNSFFLKKIFPLDFLRINKRDFFLEKHFVKEQDKFIKNQTIFFQYGDDIFLQHSDIQVILKSKQILDQWLIRHGLQLENTSNCKQGFKQNKKQLKYKKNNPVSSMILRPIIFPLKIRRQQCLLFILSSPIKKIGRPTSRSRQKKDISFLKADCKFLEKKSQTLFSTILPSVHFLGFHIFFSSSLANFRKEEKQKFSKKLFSQLNVFVQPSKSNIRNHLQQIKYVIHSCNSQTQEFLIQKLAPIIRDWCSYFQILSNRKIFYYCDYLTFKMLWRWACRRHSNKNKRWIKSRYFHSLNGRDWVFGIYKKSRNKRSLLFVCLPNHSETKLVKHTKKNFGESIYFQFNQI